MKKTYPAASCQRLSDRYTKRRNHKLQKEAMQLASVISGKMKVSAKTADPVIEISSLLVNGSIKPSAKAERISPAVFYRAFLALWQAGYAVYKADEAGQATYFCTFNREKIKEGESVFVYDEASSQRTEDGEVFYPF